MPKFIEVHLRYNDREVLLNIDSILYIRRETDTTYCEIYLNDKTSTILLTKEAHITVKRLLKDFIIN